MSPAISGVKYLFQIIQRVQHKCISCKNWEHFQVHFTSIKFNFLSRRLKHRLAFILWYCRQLADETFLKNVYQHSKDRRKCKLKMPCHSWSVDSMFHNVKDQWLKTHSFFFYFIELYWISDTWKIGVYSNRHRFFLLNINWLIWLDDVYVWWMVRVLEIRHS